MTDTDWQPVRPGYCCLCNQRPLPRALTEEQATAALLAWTTLDIHPSNHAARWTAAVGAVERMRQESAS